MNLITDDVARMRAYITEHATSQSGSRLPPEPKLCEALGVSRGRLRTVLKRLEVEGLIWRHVGKGTFIGPRDVTTDSARLLPTASIDDLLDARLILEPQLAAQAAIHATPTDIAQLEQCLADMAGAMPFMRWKQGDERLHRCIADATHNTVLRMFYDAMRNQMRLTLDGRIETVYSPTTGPRRETDDEHHHLVDAIRAHNPDRAEETMRAHLRSVRTRLFGQR